MKKIVFTLTAFLICLLSNAQGIVNPNDVKPEKDYDNISVTKVYSDSLTSSFVIWVKKEVKLHKHVEHSEQLFVLQGSADMVIGDENYSIVKGDFVIIPNNTAHSLKVTSRDPVKMISVQSPEFNGKDRVFIE